MAKTIANLRVGVRMYLDESQQADFTDIEVDREINYAYHDLISKVMEIYEEFYATTTPKNVSTVASQQEYSLDTGLIKVTRVEINYSPSDANSQAVRAIPVKMDEIPLNLGNTAIEGSTLFNAGYYLHGPQGSQKIGFVPVPLQTGTNNVRIWGIEAPSDLSDNNTTVSIPYPDNFSQLVEKKAAATLLKKGQQEVTAGDNLLKEYAIGLLDMQTFLKERIADGAWVIQDSMGEDIQFENPF